MSEHKDTSKKRNMPTGHQNSKRRRSSSSMVSINAKLSAASDDEDVLQESEYDLETCSTIAPRKKFWSGFPENLNTPKAPEQNDSHYTIRNLPQEIKNFQLKKKAYDIIFPLDTDLEEISHKIDEDLCFAAYMVTKLRPYRPTKSSCPNSYGLAKIMTDDLLSQYNWHGSHGRKPFGQLEGLNQVIYDAWKGPGSNKACYVESIKKQMYAARQRRYQRIKAQQAANSSSQSINKPLDENKDGNQSEASDGIEEIYLDTHQDGHDSMQEQSTTITDLESKIERLLDVMKSNVPVPLAQKESFLNFENRITSLEVAFNSISESMKELVQHVKEIKTHLMIKSKRKRDVVLPLTDDLEQLNERIENDADFAAQMVKIFEPFKPTKDRTPSNYGLSKIMTDDLLAQYNWDGSHGRKEFRYLNGLNQVLYDAWCEPEDSKDFYIKSIRTQMETARHRRFQRKRVEDVAALIDPLLCKSMKNKFK